MNGSEFINHLLNISKEMRKFTHEDAPVIMGKNAVDHFTENFQQEGFVNNGLQKWDEVKRRMNPKITGAAASRPILTGETGDLGMSIDYKNAENGEVTIFSDLPYSEAHNEGTTTAGRSHNVTIPQRQFIGDSAELDKKNLEEIEKHVKRILRG
jgi:phage gpG-like protein